MGRRRTVGGRFLHGAASVSAVSPFSHGGGRHPTWYCACQADGLVSRQFLFSCILATTIALAASGCATAFFGVLGAAGCRGNTDCMGRALSTGASLDAAIIQHAARGGGRHATRPAAPSSSGYLCISSDGQYKFSASELRAAQEHCRTYSGSDPTLLDHGCECFAVDSAEPSAPPTAGGDAPPATPENYATVSVPPPPGAEPPRSPQSEAGPTEDEVREALSFAAVRARECGAARFGMAATDIVFDRDGRVRSVEVHAVGLPPQLRTCIVDAVREARVPPLHREALRVRYPIRL